MVLHCSPLERSLTSLFMLMVRPPKRGDYALVYEEGSIFHFKLILVGKGDSSDTE